MLFVKYHPVCLHVHAVQTGSEQCHTRRLYQRLFAISSFVSSGFHLLNLKNDGLRKKFDSLKYDLKKRR